MQLTLNKPVLCVLAMLGLSAAFAAGYNWRDLSPTEIAASPPAVAAPVEAVAKVVRLPLPDPVVQQPPQETGPTYTVVVVDHLGNHLEMTDSEYVELTRTTGVCPAIVDVKHSSPWTPPAALNR